MNTMTSVHVVLLFTWWIARVHTNSANKIVCTTRPTPEPTRSLQTATPYPTQPQAQTQPTKPPTDAPIITQTVAPCNPYSLDTIILNDVSCPMSVDHCHYQQQQLGTILRSIKPEDDSRNSLPNSRVAYIEFDSTTTPQIVVSLHDTTYNELPVDQSDIDALATVITNSANCADAPQRAASPPNLQDAIKLAVDQFTVDSDETNRDKQIVIFSHCKADNSPQICADEEIQNAIHNGHNGVNIVMINIGSHFTQNDLYILCLVEYDPDRMYIVDSAIHEDDLVSIRNEICSAPTPGPTADPTVDPTERRRLIDAENTYDITSGFNGSPCIEMNIKLETENLLPLNSDPDPVSNIIVIAKAIANKTLGTVTIPDSYDPEENDTMPYTNVVWDIDDSCADGVPQMDRGYIPTVSKGITFNFDITDEGSDGFTATAELQTNDSLMYLTHVEYLPFTMSHDCSQGDLIIQGAIYDHENVLVAMTESLSVSKHDDASHIFNFESTVKLLPGVLYQIHFALINDYPTRCEFNDIYFGDSSRRRLADDTTMTAELKPSACYLGLQLAKSDAMRAGAAAMCNEDLGDSMKDQIEEGLFRQHISQSAMHNHLFKTGSLHLFDTSGLETFTTTDFPGFNVQSPCVAVDEEHNILFAIGGHIDQQATDLIQAYQFTDNNLTNGTVLKVGDWKLDKARYGSTCFYWKDGSVGKLVVISGMATVAEEFKSRGKWFKDVRSFSVPEYIFNQSIFNTPLAFIPPSYPRTGTYTLPANIIDQKPMLYTNHLLYLWGGKTHKASKDAVVLMDLGNIQEDATVNTLVIAQRMELGEHRALPLTDLVNYDNSSCYMIFDGQKYLKAEAAYTNSSLVQLFCNDEIESDEDTRRRLSGDDMPKMSAFDIEMMEEGRRRRLQGAESDDGEVLMSTYEYGLDGIWYNFSVNFELCYENNEKLRAAETEYRTIVDGKPDAFPWVRWREEIADEILRVSQEVYEGWSNGFGAVKVWDLDILDVRYQYTPSPAPEVELSHPQRRKARHWWNSDDGNDEHFIWIDEKFDNGDSDEDMDDV